MKAIAAMAVLTLTAWAGLPAAVSWTVRSRAKERGWELEFESAKWGSSEIRLHRVRASNGWLKADLNDVVLGLDGTSLLSVRALGGRVEADLARRPKTEGEGKTGGVRTSAKDLRVDVSGLCGDGRAEASGVAKEEDGRTSAERATAMCSGWLVEAEEVQRSGSALRAGRILARRSETAPTKGGSGATSGGHPVDRLADVPDFSAEVGELHVEAPSGYVRASGVKASRFPDRRSGIDQSGFQVEAESVTAEGSPEWGEFTARKASMSVVRAPMVFGSPHILAQFHASSLGGGVDALAKDKMEAKMVYVEGALDEEALRSGTVKDDMLTVRVGDITAQGTLTFKDRKNFSIHIAVPKTPCQKAVESAPSVFVDKLVGFKMSGTFEPEVHVDGRDGKFDVRLSFQNRCKVEKVPDEMSVKTFSRKFKRFVPGLKGDIEVESGPGSEAWTSLDRVSPFMVKAVMTTEDTGFFVHRGIVEQSIANSMKENLEKDKFARGGSTVTMQLAKNLWLSRTKTMARKAQEFFLTTYLEQSLTKQEIMELYLNVIEYGPEVYGIKRASAHYFGKNPVDLTVGEAAFLASVLPSPKREHFSKEGKLKDGWDGWVKTIVKTMRKRDLITEAEEAEGLKEEVTKGESASGGLSPVTVMPGGVDPKTWH